MTEHQGTFQRACTELGKPPPLAYFNGTKPLSLHTEASRRQGLGFVLRQKEDDEWRVVQAGSRFLTETEGRYATIELEMLVVTWAVKKCHIFLAGVPIFAIVTDHKPLIPVLNTKRLDEIENARLQRLRRYLVEYSLSASWCQGKKHSAADALSRAPVTAPASEDELAEDEATLTVRQVLVRSMEAEQLNLCLQDAQQATEKDPDLQMLQDYIQSDFPDQKVNVPLSSHPFWNVRHELSTESGLVLLGCRIVVPTSMRRDVLKALHASHQGIEERRLELDRLFFGQD